MNLKEIKEDREHCYAGVDYELEELVDWLIAEVERLEDENHALAYTRDQLLRILEGERKPKEDDKFCCQIRLEATAESNQLRAENEEMIERFNAQAICAEEFAKTMAENAMIKKANAELEAQVLYWKVKCHGKGLCSMSNEEIYELIEGAANMLRGMTMDRAIPAYAKEVMELKIKALERALFHISVEPDEEIGQ